MELYVLEREQLIPRPRPEVFAFFSDARNLERVTPPRLSFRILTPMPIAMHAGARIDYRLSLFGVPFRWRTLIESYSPDESFVDVQLSGPYRSWHHIHRFEERGDGTVMSDRVEYSLPLGPLGGVAHALFVARQLRSVFDFRRATIAALFPFASASPSDRSHAQGGGGVDGPRA
jgi:ligand-binding SRPBCC domain-containing protein